MKFRLTGSVGKGGANHIADVKLIQALLTVYLRDECSKYLTINGKLDVDTQTAIDKFQKEKLKLAKFDGRVDPAGNTYRSLLAVLALVLKDNQVTVKPAEGVVTFDSEGAEGGLFHSRILHVPTESSGLTLGRGYDMKEKSNAKIILDLTKAGLDTKTTLLISKAGGKSGVVARQFIIDNDLLDFQISPLVQKELFMISYKDESAEAKRICTLGRIEKIYGKCDWDSIDSKIKEITVDLKFRGDYTEVTRKNLQPHIVKNDITEFTKVMQDRSKWTGVPQDRFDRRVNFLLKKENK